jgi:hypothetical protein
VAYASRARISKTAPLSCSAATAGGTGHIVFGGTCQNFQFLQNFHKTPALKIPEQMFNIEILQIAKFLIANSKNQA